MIWILFAGCGARLDEPTHITLDREACDACGMLISDARFEAQLVTKEGERHVFDDPACAFRYIADHGPHLAHVWFRDSTATDEVWLEHRQVAFVPSDGAPMDGGFAAVPLDTEASMSFSEASNVVLEKGAR